MTPEEKELLERTYKLTEENNTILTSLHRTTRLSLILKVSYWVLILALSFGALYFIKPFFAAITGNTGDPSDSANSIQTLQDLLK